ncbi:hypothetical protein G6F68_014925 [Rhizopus microsporus]|nr:hypothetical protein G6F68_014925 [Rhizopus microsporus]
MLGAVVALRRGEHMRMTALVNNVSPARRAQLETVALAASLEHLGNRYDNAAARVLAKALDEANGQFLDNDKSPSRKLGTLRPAGQGADRQRAEDRRRADRRAGQGRG